MAGGIFKASQPKVRPGAYVNVTSGRHPVAATSKNGIAVIPLIGYDWGPKGEWVHLTAEAPDAEKAKLGRSIYSDNKTMRMLRLMLLNATEIYAYIPGGGKNAKGTITTKEGTANVSARYGGSLGNSLALVSVENPLGGYDVSVLLGKEEVEYFEGVKTVAELSGSDYITVEGDGKGELTAFASAHLENGSNDEEGANASVSEFLDKSEKIRFNCMAFPTDDEALITALVTKIKYIRNTIGWKCHAVVANTAADYEGIYNLTNGFEYDGVELTAAQATSWLAGAVAGADYLTSLTYAAVVGATAVVGEKTNEESVEAIKNGETFFSVGENGDVILEYDVNSKVTFSVEDPDGINKGRPCRVYDTFANDILLTFVPGRYDNNSDGWKVMEGLGRALLKSYEADGAIQNVDIENDFVVDGGQSMADSVYINAAVQALDSAEKYYFTVVAR